VHAGKKSRSDIDVVILPAPLTQFEQFIQMLEGQVMAGQALSAFGGIVNEAMPVIRAFGDAQIKEPRVYEPIKIH
jgi:hypothetical protein